MESWPWVSIGDDEWEKSGTCLRCSDAMAVTKRGAFSTVSISEDVVAALLVRANDGPLASDADGTFFARCNCTGEHLGRPPGITQGCGQWATIEPPPNGS